MKKLIATMLITLLLCTSTLFAADAEDSTYIPAPSKGMFLTTTFSPVTTGLGIGYRNNRFEVGSTISSAAIHVGTACLPLGHPIIGLIGGAMAFGGLDMYVRYDMLQSPKFNLSAGVGGNVTYCMLGASDVSTTVGLSLHASFTTKGGTTFFAESNVPVFGYEYSSSCAPTLPQPDGNPAESTQTVTEHTESGWLFDQPDNAFIFNGLMTTRIGVEIDL